MSLRDVLKTIYIYFCSLAIGVYFFWRRVLYLHQAPWKIWQFCVSFAICLLIWCILMYPNLRSKISPRGRP